MSYHCTISLQQALKSHMKNLGTTSSDYKTNVITVNTYVNNVLSSSLPTVTPQPTDWQDYVTAWETASADALTWVNQCMKRLLSVPADVQSYDSIIEALLNDAITQTNTLIANPNNAAALASLTNDLQQLVGQLNLVETFISGAIKALQNFSDILPQMATQLTTLSNLAASDNQADQQQIASLQTQVTQLQNDITSLTAAIVGLAIADGIALTLGIVASIAAFPVGLVTWFALGPAVAVATTYIALDAKQIEADKASIDQIQGQMSQLTNACAVLATMSTTYATLANGSQTIQTTLQSVLAEWQALSADVATAISDIQTATSDKTANNFAAVLQDLQAALTEWTAADTQAASLALTMNVNNAQLSIGMSQTELQAALASGQTMDLIQYFNNV